MYKDIFTDILEAIAIGGEYIELSRVNDIPIWFALVKKDDYVYYGYTFGFGNEDFVFKLLEFCNKNDLQIIVSFNQSKKDIHLCE